MTPAASDFYVLGGTLPRDAPSYVVRKADEDLLDGLRRGQFCYVLTSRQRGKSSLMVRTATRLRSEHVTCLVLDLTSVGQNLTEDQWYDGLLNRIATQVDLEDELDAFWLSHRHLGPLQRWMHALQSVLLANVSGRIVLFVDEIDAVRSLPFSADEFFAAIRECYNRRVEEREFERLTFCLIGVATPADLIRDTRATPFNIGRRIELTDFTEAEAAPLAEGFPHHKGLLRRALYWTGGHPYLTQRLCQAMAEEKASHVADVDRICAGLFLSTGARHRDDNLLFVRERLLRSEVERAELLEIYAPILAGKRIRDDETDPVKSVLKLSGVVRVEGTYLRVRNRIYAHVFDRAWIRDNMPDAELRRQKMAYRRGVLRATAVSAGIVMATSGMALIALQQSKRAKWSAMNMSIAQNQAKQEAQTARRYLYAADMSLAQLAWKDRDLGRVHELLEALKPAPGQPDLRGFEWGLLWRRGQFGEPCLPLQSSWVYTHVAFSNTGKSLRTNDGHGNITFWDAQTGQVIPKPIGETFDTRVTDLSPDGRVRAGGTDYLSEFWDQWKRSHVTLYNAKTGTPLHTLEGAVITHDGRHSFAFSADSKLIATDSVDSGVVLWEVTTGKRILSFPDCSGLLAFSPDGKRLAAESNTYGFHCIKILDLVKAGEPRTVSGVWDDFALSPDGKMLVTHTPTQVTLRDAETFSTLKNLPGASEPFAFSPDGKTVATGSNNWQMHLILFWDIASGRETGRITAGAGEKAALVYSPDGKMLASDNPVELWDASTHQKLRSFPNTYAPAFSPDSQILAVAESGKGVVLYDCKTGGKIQTLKDAQAPIAFAPWMATLNSQAPSAFRPRGSQLATGGPDNTVLLWEGGRNMVYRKLFTLKGHRSGIHTLLFSPDGKRLLTGDIDNLQTVRFWDTATGQQTFELPGRTHRTDITTYTLCFSPDGKRLYSGNQDDTTRVWEAEP